MASEGDKLTLLEHARQARRGCDGNSMWDWSDLHQAGRNGLTNDEYFKEANIEDAIIIECWKYANGDTSSGFTIPEEEVKYIKEDDIPNWLEQSPRDDRQLCAGLRLIHKFQSNIWESPFNQQTFAAINHKFDLPNVFLHVSSSLSGACGTFVSKDSRSVTFVCRRTDDSRNVNIVLRHDFETDITVGYLLSEGSTIIHHALLGIPQQFRIQAHPLLVPFLIAELMLAAVSIHQNHLDRDIFEIEKATGFNDYSVATSDIDPQDYRNLSKDLGRVATRFAREKARLLALKAMYEFCSRQLKSCRSWMPTYKWENYAETTRTLVERAEYTASHMENLLFYRGIEMRLEVQQNVIFNLIAQEDNKTNIQLSDEMRQIAMKTKRDGSVMKTIAFLGTLFLPATFVSTLFAMPLFNWGAPTTSEILSDHFWIYWAVTCPLTVAAMTIVGYWVLSRAQKNLEYKHPSSGGPQPSRFKGLKEKLDFRKRPPFKTEHSV